MKPEALLHILTTADEQREDGLLAQWVTTLPPALSAEMADL